MRVSITNMIFSVLSDLWNPRGANISASCLELHLSYREIVIFSEICGTS